MLGGGWVGGVLGFRWGPETDHGVCGIGGVPTLRNGTKDGGTRAVWWVGGEPGAEAPFLGGSFS